jgi:serine/threonine protein kinase
MTDPQKTIVLASQIDNTASSDAEQYSHSDTTEVTKGSILSDRYIIDAKIGEGGMGVVYSGSDKQLDRKLAIKLLKKNVSQDKKAVETLKQEAQVSMMLTHPSIMRLINFEQDGEYAFLLMELINGLDLLTMAERKPGKRMGQKVVAQIAYKVCGALDYAHKKNVVHRDIKPANIMISSKREVKLMDFGIARILVSESDDHPQIAGTLSYMAPEVLLGEKPDARCDLYALGLTMYQLISGKVAFEGKKANEIIDQHINKAPAPIEDCDNTLAKIIFQCIEKKPNARFQTAGQLRTALGKFLGIDEGDKLSKMKSKMEYEQRKLERDRRQIENQARQLENKLEEEKYGSASVPTLAIGEYATKQKTGSLPFMVAVVAAVAGLVGAQLKMMLGEGELIEFESLQTYQLTSWAVLGVIIVSVPAFFRSGIGSALIGAMAGAIGGAIVLNADIAINDYLIEQEIWATHFMFTYLPMALLFSAGAVATQITHLKLKSIAKLWIFVTAVTLISAIFPYMELAEFALGMTLETSISFYAPLLSVIIWVCLDIKESKLE